MRFTSLSCITLLLLGACASPPPEPASAPSPPPLATSRPSAAAPSARVAEPHQGARTWDQMRVHAAKRITAAHPDAVYHGKPPDILLAIPVLEVELNADGSVRKIEVLRHPRQAKDTTQLAIDAVHRAAPFGDVSKLPKPWKFVETFLFNDERKFKLRTLDS